MPRILLSGSTGLIGRRILADRRAAGDTVIPLLRSSPHQTTSTDGIPWDPTSSSLDPALVSGFDAVIHLSGDPVASSRWTAEKKRRILDSRVRSTSTLVAALAAAPHPPRAFLCASGINIYGDRGSTILAEDLAESPPPAAGFLADVCRAWETACDPLRPHSRVLSLRIGAVLSAEGGILGTMLPIFRFGLGGPVAGGRAWLSWISLDDLSRAIAHLLTSDLAGPLNLVSPAPVTGREFTAALAAALHRPAILPVPAWLLRLLFGQLADETMLSSIRAIPQRLLDDGFLFHQPSLAQALARIPLAG